MVTVDKESLKEMPGYWELIEWVNDHPPMTMHGPYEERHEAMFQARYYRQSGLWADAVKTACVVGRNVDGNDGTE